ncbi:hypothetical protein [Nitrosomonas communis]|uniref:hypothetical protein n=1 Tax=Nitrosomonas communis TaxID=44574 RepID=UPI003D29208E
MTEEPLFKSTHEALVFAFNYAGQQSPKTPLMRMIQSKDLEDDRLGPVKKSKGLAGLDGAAQAGMILAEVCRLPDDQHNVIVARYYRAQYECKCCEQPRPREEWKIAIDALSHCIELEGVHKHVRLQMVRKAICGGDIDIKGLCDKYLLSKPTLYRQLSMLKQKYRKIESMAMIRLDKQFSDNKLLVA